jgi:hypothetical protein
MADKMDFNDARKQGVPDPRAKIDAAQVKQRLHDNYRQVLEYLLPYGKFVGDEFHCGNIDGAPGDSLKISTRKNKMGVGSDFAAGLKFGDLIDVWKAVKREDYWTAIQNIAGFLNLAPQQPARGTKPPGKNDQPDIGPPVAQYNYTDADGVIQLVVYRHEYIDSTGAPKKSFKVWNAATSKWEAPKKNRPLYNLPGIKDSETVVLAEGEKATNALITAGIPATSAMSGAKAPPDKTDWSPLAGKRVLIWPDNDTPGLSFAHAAAHAAQKAGAASVVILPVPPGKPEGWDAADAADEGIDLANHIAEAGKQATPLQELPAPVSRPRIMDWAASQFAPGQAKPVEWLVQDIFPTGSAGVVAVAGGGGKGLLMLDLGLKVAVPRISGGILDVYPMAFGHPVVKTGAVVIFAAEDDWHEMHRRLDRLDPDGLRVHPDAQLFIMTLPNAGGPKTLFTSSSEGVKATAEWEELKSELTSIPNLCLVVFDPLSCFINVNIDIDNNAAQYILGMFSCLATELNATVILCHHTTKDSGSRSGHKITAMAARATIRGATAIVNGGRWAYVMWTDDEKNLREECAGLNIDWREDRIFKGALVKANLGGDKTTHVFVRDLSTGLLIDRTDEFKKSAYYAKDRALDDLIAAIGEAARSGLPYTKYGQNSLYERRSDLDPSFHKHGRQFFEKGIQKLLNTNRIVKCAAKGSKIVKWLDVPDGPFAHGIGQFSLGAKTHENEE